MAAATNEAGSVSENMHPYDGSPNAPLPLFKGPIEEQQAGTLVEAVALVARAVTAKIAYHQAQIDALRRALRPFNDMAARDPSLSITGDSNVNEAMDQLLAIARKLT